MYLAADDDAESAEAVGEKMFSNVPVSFVGDEPHIATSGDFTFFAGARSDAFFFDFDGVKNLFDTSGGRNFTALTLPGESPWTGVDSNTKANVFSTAIEMPTSFLGADPDIRIWGRCSLRRDGKLLHVDRAGHPSVSSFFNTDDTKEEYNASGRPATGSAGSACSSTCWDTPADTRANKPSERSTTRARCLTCWPSTRPNRRNTRTAVSSPTTSSTTGWRS